MPIPPGHRALRKGRWPLCGGIYLVTFTTGRRRTWFERFDIAAAASRSFDISAAEERSDLLCWVLMPDHFHGLIRLGEGASLSRCVQRLKSRSAKACHGLISGRLPIWARGFHDHAARQQEDLRSLARYIIANPVRAGLVANAMDYPFWDAVWL